MNAQQEPVFDHEKLAVYRESLALIGWLTELLDSAGSVGDVKEQLDRAATSIVLNIAEGNGKFLPKDRCRFFDIARGSALECAAGLDVLVAKRKARADEVREGKLTISNIVRMLMGLIKRNSARVYDKRSNKAPPLS